MKPVPEKESHTDTELSEETLAGMEELYAVLKGIYFEMRKEGYEIVDGIMTHKNEYKESE